MKENVTYVQIALKMRNIERQTMLEKFHNLFTNFKNLNEKETFSFIMKSDDECKITLVARYLKLFIKKRGQI